MFVVVLLDTTKSLLLNHFGNDIIKYKGNLGREETLDPRN